MKLYQLFSYLLIILLSALGIFRGAEMVIKGDSDLTNASSVYLKLSEYADLQSIGWLLLLGSIILLVSIFFKDEAFFLLLFIGGITCGFIHLAYGFFSVDSAKLINTYYSNLTLSIYQFIMALVGVINLWKIKRKKNY